MSQNVIEITEANFETEVLKSQLPFILDFSAVWCGPCKALHPIVEKLADENQGTVRVGKVDIDDSPAIAAKFGIRSVPTVVGFKSGVETGRHIGAGPGTTKDALLKLVTK